MRGQTKPKVSMWLIFTLVMMCFLIGFLSGLAVMVYVPIQVMQNITLNLDGMITDMFNSIHLLVWYVY